MNRFDFDRLLSKQLRRRGLIIGAGSLTGMLLSQSARNAIASQEPRIIVAQPKLSDYPFKLGVASGDPLPDGVVLWTRLSPEPLKGGGMPIQNVPVQWQIAADERMRQVLKRGTVIATPEFAHSVHVDVRGLQPARWYWYQFKVGNELSPIGRTRTAPALGDRVNQLNFAFASCQDWESGYYTAYRHMAEENLDVVLHLGDYIYEGSPRSDRPRQHANPEPVDLEGYRIRYAQYKTDPDLQAAHAAFPFICTWDDHEVDNDYADEESEEFTDPAVFLRRRAAAYQAYYEHLPLRSLPMGPDLRLYRRFTFGDLAEFNVLDTRQYRDDQACGSNNEGGGQVVTNCSERLNPTRTLLGNAQEKWLLNGLDCSRGQWNVIAQQYLMAQLEQKPGPDEGYWSDGWDGYSASRRRILEFIQQCRPSNPVVIGGDIHSFWVTDLKPDFRNPTSPVVASEFVGTSISSGGIPYDRVAPLLPDNPHIKFFDSRLRGYVRCSVDRRHWTTNLRVVDTVKQPGAPVRTLATYVVENGRSGPQRV